MKTLANLVAAIELVSLDEIRESGNISFLEIAAFAKQILPMLKIIDQSTPVTDLDDDFVKRHTLDTAAKNAGFNDEAIDALNYILHVGDWFFEAVA